MLMEIALFGVEEDKRLPHCKRLQRAEVRQKMNRPSKHFDGFLWRLNQRSAKGGGVEEGYPLYGEAWSPSLAHS